MQKDIDFSNPLADKLAEAQPQEEQENRLVKVKVALSELLTNYKLSEIEKVVVLSEILASLTRIQLKNEWK